SAAMRSLLKLLLILSCIYTGDGHWLRLLTGRQTEDGQREASGKQREIPVRARLPRSTLDSQCELRSILLKVRDLELGYDSDETVLFKYCSGTCPHVRSNHDLSLNNLLLSGVIPQPVPGGQWHSSPCCRPTHHEDMAFLDNSHCWHKVEKLSAAGCTCMG
uniref:Artemin n=1 Tax=Gouania willdenowi TaxID=441366 RepID=A0A8C5DB76_GOUWI